MLSARNRVGPCLHPSRFGDRQRVKVGDFVEIKNSRIGDGPKSPIWPMGDAKVGPIPISVGVTANYDGKKKSVTEIGNDAFIGSNCNLVAPVKVGDGAYVAAGSTITELRPGHCPEQADSKVD